jgi:uncharacterized protein YjbI with pentapeptide repeats
MSPKASLAGAELPEIELVDAEIPGADFSAASMVRTGLSGRNLRQIPRADF